MQACAGVYASARRSQPGACSGIDSPTPLALAFAAGVGGLFLLPALPGRWILLALAAVALLSGLLAVFLRPLRALGWVAMAAAAGVAWAYVDACRVLCAPFPEDLVRRSVVAEGRIVSLPERTGTAQRFVLQIDRLRLDAAPIRFRGRVRLSWYRDAPALRAGERWRLTLRLKPPHGFLNPGGFDYERWLFQRGIAATGHVRAADSAVLLDAGPGGQWLNRWRQGLRDRLDGLLPGGVPAALVRALVLGDRGGLTPTQWEVFSHTGTSHLIAISGLHVGLVAGFVFLLVRLGWAQVPRLARRFGAPRAAAAAALVAATGYAGLAGFSVSTQRALVMLAVLLVATMAGRTLRPLSGLSLALLAVLLIDPSSVLSYGFWLSFGAVAMLFYALGQRLAPPFAVLRWGRAQWAVALGLLPLLLLFFGRASLVAPAVNLVLVPLFGLVLPLVLLSTALALAAGSAWALAPVAWLLEAGYGLLAAIAGSELASLTLSARAGWVWLAAGAGVLLLLAPRGIPARWLGAVLLLPMLLARPAAPRTGEAELMMLDVGQGLSVVVRTARHALVYDMGPRFPSGFNTGAAVLAPYLKHLGISSVDIAVASHADQDHAGGLGGLMRNMPLGRLLSGEPDDLDVPAEPCRAGMNWRWDEVDFRFLHPWQPGAVGNDASCVLRIATAGATALLTGDVGSGVEAALVARDASALRADVLIAAHHGSDSSSSAAFLQAVDPAWVWFSAGYANRYGFPNDAVVARVAAQGSATASTATDGAVSLLLPAARGPLLPRRHRLQDRRLWRHWPSGSGD
jgi:competence protein ComEC